MPLLPPDWRERLLFRLPTSVTTLPYETMLAVACVFSGLPLTLLGQGRPGSIDELLPFWAARAWGATLLVCGLTFAWGLLRDGRGLTIAAAHRLLSSACLTYVISIAAVFGWSGMVAATMVMVVCLLSAFRAFYLRATIEVQERILSVAERGTRES